MGDPLMGHVKRVSREIAKLQAKNKHIFHAVKAKPRRPVCEDEPAELLFSNGENFNLREKGDVPSNLYLHNCYADEPAYEADSDAANEENVKRPSTVAGCTGRDCPTGKPHRSHLRVYKNEQNMMNAHGDLIFSKRLETRRQNLPTRETNSAISLLLRQQFLELDPSTCSVRITESRESRRSNRKVRMSSLVQKAVEMRKRCEMFKQELQDEVERGLQRESPQVIALFRNYGKLELQIADLKRELGVADCEN